MAVLLGKLFAEISLSDYLEVEYGCENSTELRACSIFKESSSVIWLIVFCNSF